MFDEMKRKAEEATNRISQKVEEEGGWKDMMSNLQEQVCDAVEEKMDAIVEESKELHGELTAELEKKKNQASAVLDDVLDSLPDGVRETINKILAEAEQKMAEAEVYVKEKQKAFEEYKKKIEMEIRAEIEKMLLQKVHQAFELAGDELKDGIKEDEMPDFVKGTVDAAVDVILYEVELEVKHFVQKQCRETKDAYKPGPPVGWGTPCKKLRAIILYTMFPWDHSIWVQIRNPIWWLLTLIALGPIYGTSQFMFLLFFSLKDKGDEYQLVEFIFAFKTACFISHGLISMIVGATLYVLCTNKDNNSCADDGPAQYPLFQVDLAFWVLQVFLLWSAGILLPYSEPKGKTEHIKLTEEEQEAAEKEKDKDCFGNEKDDRIGRRVRRMLIYDLVVFIICAGVAVYGVVVEWKSHEAFGETSPHHWKSFALMYWMRTVYGFLSLPFVLIGLPGVFLMFTHAKPTGYNENGECVALITAEQKKARKEQGIESGMFGVDQGKVGIDIEANPARAEKVEP